MKEMATLCVIVFMDSRQPIPHFQYHFQFAEFVLTATEKTDSQNSDNVEFARFL